MVAYLCGGHGAKTAAAAVERSSKRTRPRAEGRGRRERDCFLYVRSHQLVENKGRRVQNEAKNEAKIDLNEAKLEAKKSKNSVICAKRTEAFESRRERKRQTVGYASFRLSLSPPQRPALEAPICGSGTRPRRRNQNELLRVLCASKALTQRSRRVSVTSVFGFHEGTKDTEKKNLRETTTSQELVSQFEMLNES